MRSSVPTTRHMTEKFSYLSTGVSAPSPLHGEGPPLHLLRRTTAGAWRQNGRQRVTFYKVGEQDVISISSYF